MRTNSDAERLPRGSYGPGQRFVNYFCFGRQAESAVEEDLWDAGPAAATPQSALSRVSDGLYLGTLMTEQNLEGLKAKGITHVLQVGTELEPSHPETFTYLSVNLKDNEDQDILRVLRPCLTWIQDARQAGGSVIVHCMAGASRSPTVCCAYLMWQWKIGATAALDIVCHAHPHTHPNPRFRAALRSFEANMQSRLEALPDTPLEAVRNVEAPSTPPDVDSDSGHDLGLSANDWS